jgi:hypothetical protein
VSRGMPITRAVLDRFKGEGFKLLGHAKTSTFDPRKSSIVPENSNNNTSE